MNKRSFFLANLFLSVARQLRFVVISIILIIVGAICSDICLYIGLFLIALNVIVAFVRAIHMQKMIYYRSDDDPEFNEMMDSLTADPKSFLSERMEDYDRKKQMHGEELLTLSDADLFETVYLQNLDIAEKTEDEDKELEQFTGARRIVYILGLYDSEIQNGGLCQFFVNSSRVVAPYVSEALRCVGANEHLELFENFITTNSIDVSDLESFMAYSIRDYKKHTKRYDFDSFDDEYYELPVLQEKVVAYIKENINEF
ncbi:MAG: DUF4375 domain-containing protein [Lachnospiraceae bacterium]|nr:DUF4375 domain-containing protein [Lachnospiraceae bacterium]